MSIARASGTDFMKLLKVVVIPAVLCLWIAGAPESNGSEGSGRRLGAAGVPHRQQAKTPAQIQNDNKIAAIQRKKAAAEKAGQKKRAAANKLQLDVNRWAEQVVAAQRAKRAAEVYMQVPKAGHLDSYTKKVDQSIDRGLEFLASLQVGEAKPGAPQSPLTGSISDTGISRVALTSLSIMAFLAKGHTPGRGLYGGTINRGIDFVLSQAIDNGLCMPLLNDAGQPHKVMYAHCIATLMLAEVSGMVDPARQERIDEVLPKALAIILRAQQVQKDPYHAGGWRYLPNSHDSDLSLTGWAIMALRAGKLNGAPVPSQNIDKAVQYIMKCRQVQSGGFGYTPGISPTHSLTGLAIVCLELSGQHGHVAIKPAGDFLMGSQPKGFRGDMLTYYGTFYGAQAAFQLGPEHWATYAPQMYENLLAGQQTDGGWPPTTDFNLGRAYATAMATLAMAPPYQQLPIYQRDESFNGDDSIGEASSSTP